MNATLFIVYGIRISNILLLLAICKLCLRQTKLLTLVCLSTLWAEQDAIHFSQHKSKNAALNLFAGKLNSLTFYCQRNLCNFFKPTQPVNIFKK